MYNEEANLDWAGEVWMRAQFIKQSSMKTIKSYTFECRDSMCWSLKPIHKDTRWRCHYSKELNGHGLFCTMNTGSWVKLAVWIDVLGYSRDEAIFMKRISQNKMESKSNCKYKRTSQIFRSNTKKETNVHTNILRDRLMLPIFVSGPAFENQILD